jgi:hypothetical protein
MRRVFKSEAKRPDYKERDRHIRVVKDKEKITTIEEALFKGTSSIPEFQGSDSHA